MLMLRMEDDEVEVDDVEDHEVKEEEMMMLMRMIMLRPKTEPTLCASLRSQNAHQHVTRATL